MGWVNWSYWAHQLETNYYFIRYTGDPGFKFQAPSWPIIIITFVSTFLVFYKGIPELRNLPPIFSNLWRLVPSFSLPKRKVSQALLTRQILKEYNGHLPTRVRDTIIATVVGCVQPEPPNRKAQKQTEDEVVATALEMCYYLEGVMPALQDDGPFSVPLIGSIKNFGWVLGEFLSFLWTPAANFSSLTFAISENRKAASTQILKKEQVAEGDVVQPKDFPGSNRDIVNAYLKHTPFYHLFDGEVAFGWKNPKARFNHTWVVAPPNSGKTTLLKALVGYDLTAVEKGEASLIIIDSEGQMIEDIKRLQLFDRVPLTVIDPAPDEDLSINPFAVEVTEANETSVVTLLTFMIGGLLESPMTAKQRGLFRRVAAALLRTPDANLKMMMDVLQGTKKLDTSSWADQELRDYIDGVFDSKDSDIKGTREQIAWRLDGIFSASSTLKRIFSSPRNDVDIAALMKTPGVTVIHTNRALLSNEGAAFLGRTFLSLILRAAESTRRGDGSDLPCFLYVDEAHSIIQNDTNVPTMVDQIRKYNVGLTFAHQRLAQLSMEVRDALSHSAGTIMAGGCRGDDAAYLGRYMGCEPWVIEKCSQGEFAVYIRDQVDSAIRLKVPGYVLDKLPRRKYIKPRREKLEAKPMNVPPTTRPTIDAETLEEVADPRRASVAPQPSESHYEALVGQMNALVGLVSRLTHLVEELIRRSPVQGITYTPPAEPEATQPKKTARGKRGYQGKKNNPNYTDSL